MHFCLGLKLRTCLTINSKVSFQNYVLLGHKLKWKSTLLTISSRQKFRYSLYIIPLWKFASFIFFNQIVYFYYIVIFLFAFPWLISLDSINEFLKFVLVSFYNKEDKTQFSYFYHSNKIWKNEKEWKKTNNGKMIRTISNLLLQWQTHFLWTFYEHINHVIDQKLRLHQW